MGNSKSKGSKASMYLAPPPKRIYGKMTYAMKLTEIEDLIDAEDIGYSAVLGAYSGDTKLLAFAMRHCLGKAELCNVDVVREFMRAGFRVSASSEEFNDKSLVEFLKESTDKSHRELYRSLVLERIAI